MSEFRHHFAISLGFLHASLFFSFVVLVSISHARAPHRSLLKLPDCTDNCFQHVVVRRVYYYYIWQRDGQPVRRT